MRSFLLSSRKGSKSWQSPWDANELLKAKQPGSFPATSVTVKYPQEELPRDKKEPGITPVHQN